LGTRGGTPAEITERLPGHGVENVSQRIRELLDARTVHRPGARRDRALVVRVGPPPDGASTGRIIMRQRVMSISTAQLLRDLQRAFNRRELTGPGDLGFLQRIDTFLAGLKSSP
jgi:hypothetical protein